MQRRRYEATSLVSLVASLMVATGLPSFADDASSNPTLRPAAVDGSSNALADTRDLPARIRKSYRLAYVMAKYEWLDKISAADPRVLAAICERPGPAAVLARHRHIDKLAASDHYLCRRLTRWKRATDNLVHNPKADQVINLDPQGIYFAIDRDPHVATLLASHTMFDNMVTSNPDLARAFDQHMH